MKDAAKLYVYVALGLIAFVVVMMLLPEAAVAAVCLVLDIVRLGLLLTLLGYWVASAFSSKNAACACA